MRTTTVEKEIISILKFLELKEQNKVLQFIKSLSKPFGDTEKKINKYVGGIEKNDLSRMKKVIEEGCEKVDTHGW